MHTPYGLWKRTDGALQGNFYIFYQRLQISASHTMVIIKIGRQMYRVIQKEVYYAGSRENAPY